MTEWAAEWQRVGTAVRERRLELGITQVEAAAAAGIGQMTWKRVERGVPPDFDTGVRVAVALGWPRAWLYVMAAEAISEVEA